MPNRAAFGYFSGMKRFAALLGLALAVALPSARAQQNPDDQYIAIYSQMQQADALQASGQPRQALAGYTQALAGLQKFQKMFPYWDSEIVTYRLNYLTDKVNGLAAQFPAVPQSATPTNAAVNPTPPAANAVPAAAPATDAEAQLNALRAQVQNLQSDNETLQAKLKEALRAQPATVDTQELAKAQAQVLSLMKENDLLRASLATGATTGAAPGELVKVRQALADANQKLAEQTSRADKLARENQTLQSDAKINALEKAALEARLRQRQTPAASAPAETSDEVKTLRARLAVDEAQPVPLHAGGTGLAEITGAVSGSGSSPPASQKKPISELPGGSAVLAAEAQNYFSAGDYDKAGADYLQILQRDPNNALALANLATIELHENKLEDAGKHAQAALAQSPNDAFNLAILGKVELAQGKLDDAFDVLSRAAKSDPQNPEIENYLGATLAQKGLRAQAETAFRKAIELDPNYGCGAQQSRRGLSGRKAADGRARPLALSKGARSRPAAQSRAGKNTRRPGRAGLAVKK